MQVSWVISSEYKDDKATPEQLKAIGNTWGSWKTWRSYSTTNVLCTNDEKARDLIKRAFHSVCNFYIPQKSYAALGRPPGVQVFDGQFPGDFDNQEDIENITCDTYESVLQLLGDLNLDSDT